MSTSHSLTVFVACLATCACAALGGCSLGGPKLVAASDKKGAPYIDGCKNVDVSRGVSNLGDEYIDRNYLTTWRSAVIEGLGEGVVESAEAADHASDIVLTALLGSTARRLQLRNAHGNAGRAGEPMRRNERSAAADAYCRFFHSEPEPVYDAARATLSSLPHGVLKDDKLLGQLATNFRVRHRGTHSWKDRYLVMLKPAIHEGALGTIVAVHRDVFINRSGRYYNRGESVGHNETWVLFEMSRHLR